MHRTQERDRFQPLLTNLTKPRVVFCRKLLCSRFGLELGDAESGGASDGNTTSFYAATVDGLGALGDGAHARHEHVRVSKLVERTALLALILMMPPLEGS